jgi:hypothetical protein
MGEVLQSRNRVIVVADNLDKGWKPRHDLATLSEFIYGLLGVGTEIAADFNKQGLRKQKVKLSLIIFLRTDIFSHVLRNAREGDKLAATHIYWDDPILLQRVVEERFNSSLGTQKLPDEIWTEFFVDRVKGTVTRDYITSCVLPRPRDVIYLCKAALSNALNHGHNRIEEDDLLAAEKVYSDFVFRSLQAELLTDFNNIGDILVRFVGESEILTRDEVLRLISITGLTDDQIDVLIRMLVDLSFFGIEVDQDVFIFIYEGDDNRRKIELEKSNKYTARVGARRYRISKAFHSYLGILEVSPS